MISHLRMNTAITAVLLAAACGLAVDVAPRTIEWSAKSIQGADIAVPRADHISVVIFAMADQQRSAQAIQQTQRVLAERKDVQSILVVSGEEAAFKAQRLQQTTGWTAPIVGDPTYAASGKMQVHVWPTVVVVDAAGLVAGQIAGLPASLAKDLDAYVRFAAKQIDREQLDAALRGHDVAADTPQQAAHRHLQVAQRLMELQQFDQAREQLQQGLTLVADDPLLLLEMARVDVLTGQAAAAIARLSALSPDAVPAWRMNALRGRALAMLGQWDQARAALVEGLKLNPEPAETYYFLGRACEQAGDWPAAAKAYRQSFEHSPLGRRTVAVQ